MGPSYVIAVEGRRGPMKQGPLLRIAYRVCAYRRVCDCVRDSWEPDMASRQAARTTQSPLPVRPPGLSGRPGIGPSPKGRELLRLEPIELLAQAPRKEAALA